MLLKTKRVEIVPHMSAFLVQSKNQKTHGVQLYPKKHATV